MSASAAHKILEILAILGLLLSFVLIWIMWSGLPEEIPRHYNSFGEVDGWGHKAVIFTLPGVSVFVYAFLSLIGRLPRVMNISHREIEEKREDALNIIRKLLVWLKVEIIWFFFYIEWRTIEIAGGKAESLGGLFMPLFVGVIAATVFIFMARLYRLRHPIASH